MEIAKVDKGLGTNVSRGLDGTVVKKKKKKEEWPDPRKRKRPGR